MNATAQKFLTSMIMIGLIALLILAGVAGYLSINQKIDTFQAQVVAGPAGQQGEPGPEGPQGLQGPEGPAGMNGLNADPAQAAALAVTLIAEMQPTATPAPTSTAMPTATATMNVTDTVKATVDAMTTGTPTAEPMAAAIAPAGVAPAPAIAGAAAVNPAAAKLGAVDLPVGFTPDLKLVDISKQVNLRPVAADLSLYKCFPQDYAQGDSFNRGCQKLQNDGKLPWKKPLAGFNYDYNAIDVICGDTTGTCNIPVDTFKWVSITGESVSLPGIGTMHDPDGGIVVVTIMNAWEVPGKIEGAIIHSGWLGTGEIWDMSDLTTNWDDSTKTYVNNKFGDASVETSATLRDHILYKSGFDPEFRGKCSLATNCRSALWVNVFRWYDGNYYLLGFGEWHRADFATATPTSTP